VAANAVRFCNDRQAKRVDGKILEDALAKTLVSAEAVFSQILRERSPKFPDAWEYLKGFRRNEQLPAPDDDELRKVLKRHLIVNEINGDEKLEMKIPLMRRWLIERA
jgi:hypothetical protein